ncbi:ATP-binding cassette domain-containing protein [Jeotgalibacillus sp. R-1-5s-1]|uniref:ATP-binding cassette domain-containing protein n=1 Tax=Jeotgalibacillus sp. R-1-5s-1 TaxID=2555897 RepID=UPI00106AB841|nr:ABC transporter ATP-binding protein [Jeotgalibacillus sp. R-1-5s-1]TFD99531.1 ABC transporter ATP-binding protein [Jeotgalibacillus sp. R-1-5s-1]
MTVFIKATHASKTIRKKPIIKDLSLEIKKGGIHAIVGQRLSGKTAVLKLLTGLWLPDRGEITLFDQQGTVTPRDQSVHIGAFIDQPVLYDRLSASENLYLFSQYFGYYDIKSVEKGLTDVGLRDDALSKTSTFSFSMKKRLAIARALFLQPPFVVLDDPFTGLDLAEQHHIRQLLIELNTYQHTTILLSTPDVSEVEDFAHTITLLRDGRTLETMSTLELKHRLSSFIHLNVDHAAKATFILENNLNITDFQVMDLQTIRIYDTSHPVYVIVQEIVKGGIQMNEVYHKQLDLEAYMAGTSRREPR